MPIVDSLRPGSKVTGLDLSKRTPCELRALTQNRFAWLPGAVRKNVLFPFFSFRDLANFQTVSKETTDTTTYAPLLIGKYKLEGLIRKYLHLQPSNNGEHLWALNELMEMASRIAIVERLPKPSLATINGIFAIAEAKNLIRMVEIITNVESIPGLYPAIDNLRFPKDPKKLFEKAALIRNVLKAQKKKLSCAFEDLDFSGNVLTVLPKEIGLFTSVETLNLSSCRIVALPREIRHLTCLEKLDLSNNLLSLLPKELGELNSLRYLLVGGNHLRALPKETAQLTMLEELDVSNNRLSSLPIEIQQLQALKFLSLNKNRFVVLPQAVLRLNRLRKLNLSDNLLRAIPPEIGELKALVYLGLHKNLLKALPQEMGNLRSLFSLNVAHNQLTSIPGEFVHLRELSKFQIEGNGFIDLPEHFGKYAPMLEKQNKKTLLKAFLNRLIFYIMKSNAALELNKILDAMDRKLESGIRYKLYGCLYDVCNKEWIDPALRQFLKDPFFGKKAFVDPTIEPRLKLAAVRLLFFRLNKQKAANTA